MLIAVHSHHLSWKVSNEDIMQAFAVLLTVLSPMPCCGRLKMTVQGARAPLTLTAEVLPVIPGVHMV